MTLAAKNKTGKNAGLSQIDISSHLRTDLESSESGWQDRDDDSELDKISINLPQMTGTKGVVGITATTDQDELNDRSDFTSTKQTDYTSLFFSTRQTYQSLKQSVVVKQPPKNLALKAKNGLPNLFILMDILSIQEPSIQAASIMRALNRRCNAFFTSNQEYFYGRILHITNLLGLENDESSFSPVHFERIV